MSAKTKIVVIHMKELVYTGIFLLLGILLILLLVFMFSPARESKDVDAPAGIHTEHAALYQPGVYTSSILLGNQALDIEVIVDSDYISSISFVNLDETVATMYPLMEGSLQELSDQICSSQSTENISYPEGNEYTCDILMGAIRQALEKAKINSSPGT